VAAPAPSHAPSHPTPPTRPAPPRCRHQLSLFAHVSKINWDLDLKDRVAGTMSDTRGGDIRPFCLDPATTSQFDIVNQLWDNM
jgi:kinetochore protein Spc24